jgi:uncharacterized protein
VSNSRRAKQRIVLGTAQFGSDYGVNNKRGKVPESEVLEILDVALRSGIEVIDTAYNYGDSEDLIGRYVKKRGEKFKIISKLPSCEGPEVKELFRDSLSRLNVDSVYGYLLHDFNSFRKAPQVWENLRKLKSEKKIEKIGFSLYYPGELESIIEENIEFDLLQVPYNIFDRRFGPLFARLKKRGVEVHTRSVFLQGLVFRNPEELSGSLAKVAGKLKSLGSIAADHSMTVAQLCLNYAAGNRDIDGIVVGVDNPGNLAQIIENYNGWTKLDDADGRLRELRDDDEDVILPFNWGKEKKGV